MTPFFPERLLKALTTLEAFRAFAIALEDSGSRAGSENQAGLRLKQTETLVADLRVLELDLSLDAALQLEAFYRNRMPTDGSDAFQYDPIDVRQLGQIIHDLKGRMEGELRRPLCLIVDSSKTNHYKKPIEVIFGAPLPGAVSSLQYDLEEASKCLALRRNTAAVYHLMKVMEEMVRKLAAQAGAIAGCTVAVTKKNGDFKDWGGIISALKGATDEMTAKGMPKQAEEWLGIKNLLYAVKEAWRNPTMHPASKYTDEEAEDVFSTVSVLLRGLVKLL